MYPESTLSGPESTPSGLESTPSGPESTPSGPASTPSDDGYAGFFSSQGKLGKNEQGMAKAIEVSLRPKSAGLGACQADLAMRKQNIEDKVIEPDIEDEKTAGPAPKLWKKRNQNKRVQREYKVSSLARAVYTLDIMAAGDKFLLPPSVASFRHRPPILRSSSSLDAGCMHFVYIDLLVE
jgi:hypothetical protein